MNVTGLVDASTGAVVERYHYDPYGAVLYLDPSTWNLLGTQASAFENDYLYTGRRLDAETDLFYYRARYYDPILGRFISRDPIGYGDGPNLYQYVRAAPLVLLDPSGLEACCGPDISQWFKWQLDRIRGWARTKRSPRDPELIQAVKTMKFEEAGIRGMDNCGPIGEECKDTVTLCGTCINVTELGNIAYGYAYQHHGMKMMLFGGLFAEVQGRGFDKLADVTAAIAGGYLGDIDAGGHLGDRDGSNVQRMCAQLGQPNVPNIWGQGHLLSGVERINDLAWAQSLLPGGRQAGTDILAEWNKKHGDWERFLTDALQHFNPDQQYTLPRAEPKTLWDATQVSECSVKSDCAADRDYGWIAFRNDGTVYWA